MENLQARKEIICKSCGKTRILSEFEAKEDGWIYRYGGIMCPLCRERYGMPMIQFIHPSREDDIQEARFNHGYMISADIMRL